MKHKLIYIAILLVYAFFGADKGFAQQPKPEENLALWAQFEEELAGDAATWSLCDLEKKSITPQKILDDEGLIRTSNDPRYRKIFDNSPTYNLDLYDADSKWGAIYRTMTSVSGSTIDNYFSDYIVPTTATTELGKIKSIYNSVMQKATTCGAAQGKSAAILQESLEEAGIKSELVGSADHIWVRVTLTDPMYGAITFDLDPTWYNQAIPLPPRNQTPISDEELKRFLAIVTGISGPIDVRGRWLTRKNEFEGQQVGNHFVLVALTATIPRGVGRSNIIGTLDGTKIQGQKFLMAVECPNLDAYVPAWGTISPKGDYISVSFKNFKFYVDTCRWAYDEEDSIIYNRKNQ